MHTGELVVMQCNLASFEEIRAFVAKLHAQHTSIDFLVLNAAVKATPKWYTKEGHELQMGKPLLHEPPDAQEFDSVVCFIAVRRSCHLIILGAAVMCAGPHA